MVECDGMIVPWRSELSNHLGSMWVRQFVEVLIEYANLPGCVFQCTNNNSIFGVAEVEFSIFVSQLFSLAAEICACVIVDMTRGHIIRAVIYVEVGFLKSL